VLLEHVVEVADGLVEMEAEREADGCHGTAGQRCMAREPASAA
jgi:hypothetical protein